MVTVGMKVTFWRLLVLCPSKSHTCSIGLSQGSWQAKEGFRYCRRWRCVNGMAIWGRLARKPELCKWLITVLAETLAFLVRFVRDVASRQCLSDEILRKRVSAGVRSTRSRPVSNTSHYPRLDTVVEDVIQWTCWGRRFWRSTLRPTCQLHENVPPDSWHDSRTDDKQYTYFNLISESSTCENWAGGTCV